VDASRILCESVVYLPRRVSSADGSLAAALLGNNVAGDPPNERLKLSGQAGGGNFSFWLQTPEARNPTDRRSRRRPSSQHRHRTQSIQGSSSTAIPRRLSLAASERGSASSQPLEAAQEPSPLARDQIARHGSLRAAVGRQAVAFRERSAIAPDLADDLDAHARNGATPTFGDTVTAPDYFGFMNFSVIRSLSPMAA